MRASLALLIILVAAGTAPARAQQPQQSDSLRREIERLEARLDSLQRVLEGLVRQGRDTAAAHDELAALRAAAEVAAEEAVAGEDTTQQQTSRSRALQSLNPEISVTGDVVGGLLFPDGEDSRATAVPREFEFSFQAALDPYSYTKVFLSYEEPLEIAGFPEEDGEDEHSGGLHLEEGYLYWVGLPGRTGLKVGKFRQEIGLYNRWHTHGLLEVDRPLPSVVFLGDDGLIQTGLSLTSPALTIGPSANTAFFELTAGTNDALFEGGNQPSYLGRIESFWDLGAATYFEVGATGVYGRNSDESLETRLLQVDFAFRWSPPARALYQDLQLKGEWYWVEKQRTDLLGAHTTLGRGGWAQANYRFSRRWIAGLRGDYLEGSDTNPDVYQLVPSLSWWQSEWVRIRLQYNYLKPASGGGNHTVLLQVVWAIGPHRHEAY
jgi:hypothetical protein